MNNSMKDLISKETSDKYSELCSDIGEVLNKHESSFENIRELEYWMCQAIHYAGIKKRLSKRKEDK